MISSPAAVVEVVTPEIITFRTPADANAFRKEIWEAGLRWCRPICWHDRRLPFTTKKITGASCFFLRLQSRLIGVTAAHVVRQYEKAKRLSSSTVCQIQVAIIELDKALIDVDDDLDIATFTVSERLIKEAGAVPFDVSAKWPPDVTIKRGATIQLVGYPEEIRVINSWERSAIFQAYGARTFVEDHNARDIVVVYDPNQGIGAPNLPPLGFNMSGCSGGAAVIHETRNGLHRWSPVGFIVGGPLGRAEGEAAGFDVIRIRRIDSIGDDGHLHRPDTGWLPLTA
jgi:hypothetical protein